MVNARGFLPKARHDDLDERQRRRLEQWHEHAYEDDNMFLTLARRPGLMDAVWAWIGYTYGGGSSIDPKLFETVRQRLAFNTECLHCSAVEPKHSDRADRERRDKVLRDLFDYERADYDEATKAALRFADRLSGDDHLGFDQDEYDALREHFTEDQVLDLGMQITFFMGWQRFNGAMGILPDSWQDGSTLPWERARQLT